MKLLLISVFLLGMLGAGTAWGFCYYDPSGSDACPSGETAIGITSNPTVCSGASVSQPIWICPGNRCYGIASQNLVCPSVPPSGGPTSRGPPSNNTSNSCGSVVDSANQFIAERVPIVGVPFSFVYSSRRAAGQVSWYQNLIPLTGGSVSSSLTAVNLSAVIGTRTITYNYTSPVANYSYPLSWNGLDGSGNPVYGSQNMTITTVEVSSPTQPYERPSVTTMPIGIKTVDPTDMGGWDFSIHHYYDSVRQTLFKGDGSSYVAVSEAGHRRRFDGGVARWLRALCL